MKKILYISLLPAFFTLTASSQPEPSCACKNAELVINLTGKSLKYTEITFNLLDNGSFLVRDGLTGKYYKVKNGLASGPLSESDPEAAPFITEETSINYDPLLSKYGKYITKKGDQYLITFNGKTYGPYYEITMFHVTKSGEKFLAAVNEKESLGLKLEKLSRSMAAAKTEQERQALELKQTELVQAELLAGDDPAANLKMVSSIPGVKFNSETPMMYFTSDVKYDDIFRIGFDDNGNMFYYDLFDRLIIQVKQEMAVMGEQSFISSDNSRFAVYGNGTLTFSDGTTKSDLFNPYLTKTEGRIYLAYLYYSPSGNSIMQCKIPF